MKIGSLVECINDNFDPKLHTISLHPVLPTKGKLYTIRHIFKGYPSGIACYLEEIKSNTNPYFNIEQGFAINRFKEVQPPMEISIEDILEKVST